MNAGRHKVLLADDSATIRRVVELSFADEPIDVVWVPDGHAVPSVVERERPDVLLVDLSLPGRDGYDVTAWVQAAGLTGRVPVVVMAGAFETVDRARLEGLGASAVVTKPVEPTALVALVHELAAAASGAWPSLDGGHGASPTDPAASAAPTSSTAAVELSSAPVPSPAAATTRTDTRASDAPSRRSDGEFLDQLGAALAAAGYPVPPLDGPSVAPPGQGGGPSTAVPDQLEPVTLADAFTLVLDAEERGVPIVAEAHPLSTALISSVTIDALAQLVADRLAGSAVQTLVADRAAEVAERVARDVLARSASSAS